MPVGKREKDRAGKLAIIETYRDYRTIQIDGGKLDVFLEEYKAKERAYGQMMAKQGQGHASLVDVLKAKEEQDEAFANYKRAEGDYRREWAMFLSNLGLDGQWEIEALPREPSITPLQLTKDELVEGVIAHDIELWEAEQSLARAERELAITKSNYGIEVALQGDAHLLDEKRTDTSWKAYMSFSYPIFDGGLRRIEIKEADLAVKKAKLALSAKEKGLWQEIDVQYSQLEWLRVQAELAKSSHHRMSLEQANKEKQLSFGLISQPEVEAGQRALKLAWLNWHEAALAHEVAKLELMVEAGKAPAIEGGDPF